MPRINVTEADIDAEVTRRGQDPDRMGAQDRARIKRDLAQEQVDAHNAAHAPASAGPDHYTVTVEVTHGERVLSVTQQHIPLPTT